MRAFEGGDPAAQRKALGTLRDLDAATRQAALAVVLKLVGQAKDQEVREAAQGVIRSAFGPEVYPRAAVEEIRKKSECRPTGTTLRQREADGRLRLTVRVASNGCNFLVVGREEPPRKGNGPGR